MASCGYPNGLWLPVAIPLASSGYPNGFLWLFKWWLPVGAVLVQDYGRFGSLVVAPKAPPFPRLHDIGSTGIWSESL